MLQNNQFIKIVLSFSLQQSLLFTVKRKQRPVSCH